MKDIKHVILINTLLLYFMNSSDFYSQQIERYNMFTKAKNQDYCILTYKVYKYLLNGIAKDESPLSNIENLKSDIKEDLFYFENINNSIIKSLKTDTKLAQGFPITHFINIFTKENQSFQNLRM